MESRLAAFATVLALLSLASRASAHEPFGWREVGPHRVVVRATR